MSDRFARNNRQGGLGFLGLKEPPDPLVIAPSKLSRLDIGPGQILVAVFTVAFTFFLAVTHLATAHTSAIGRVMPGALKAPNIPRLQHDGKTEHGANAIDRTQLLELRPQPHLF